MRWTLPVVALLAVIVVLLMACSNDTQGDVDSRYSVVIIAFDPDRKIRSIKTIREETGLGLADARQIVEQTPSVVKVGLTRREAEDLAERLRAQRMAVELRPD